MHFEVLTQPLTDVAIDCRSSDLERSSSVNVVDSSQADPRGWTAETNAQRIQNPLTRKIAEFITEIGIEIVSSSIDCKTFLPGILVKQGRILADETKLTYPGDLLHEAGHLAMAPASIRSSLSREVALPDTWMEPVEVQAIAWSYAAIVYLGLDPKIVFHEGGYGVESERLLSNYNFGVYLGANGLQDAGLTFVGGQASKPGVPPYPHMLTWLRD